MADFARRTCGVYAVSDRPDRKSSHIGDEIFEAGIAHDRDAIARRDPERDQAERKHFDVLAVFAPGHFLIEAKILVAQRDGFGPRGGAFKKELRHALSIDRPGPLLVMFWNLVPISVHGPVRARSSITVF